MEFEGQKDNGAVEILVSASKRPEASNINQLQQGFSKSLSYLKQAQVRPRAQKNAIKMLLKSLYIFRIL